MRTCSIEKNKTFCTCTYPCQRHGLCCECIEYHKSMGELPACYFPKDVEATYDRSVINFIKTIQIRGPGYLRS